MLLQDDHYDRQTRKPLALVILDALWLYFSHQFQIMEWSVKYARLGKRDRTELDWIFEAYRDELQRRLE